MAVVYLIFVTGECLGSFYTRKLSQFEMYNYAIWIMSNIWKTLRFNSDVHFYIYYFVIGLCNVLQPILNGLYCGVVHNENLELFSPHYKWFGPCQILNIVGCCCS